MIQIRHIRPDEIEAAKRLIYCVAHEIFQDSRSLEESIAFYEARAQLHDVDDYQNAYMHPHGTFLVMTDNGTLPGSHAGEHIICTGAVRRIDEETCELKRLWLLSEYHGRGLGYRMMQELLAFARTKGYTRMRLETDPFAQNRAFEFYKHLGFYEIPRYSDSEDIAMEMVL